MLVFTSRHITGVLEKGVVNDTLELDKGDNPIT